MPTTSSDEDSGFVAIAGADPQAVQQQLRSVRLMAGASVLLGLASVAMMAYAALSPADAPQSMASPSSVVGLNAVSKSTEHTLNKGWYRTYLDCQVRAGKGLKSEKVDVLYVGSLVYVAETHGRRARILKPVKGWISMETSDGITILRPDMTYQAASNKTNIDEVFRSKEVREANERLKESAKKLTAVEKKLMEAIKKLKGVPRHVQDKFAKKWPELAQQMPATGERLTQHAAHVLRKTVKPEGAKNLLKHVSKDKRVQHVMRSSRLKKLVGQAKKGVEEVQSTQRDEAQLEASLEDASAELSDTSQQLVDKVGSISV